MKPLEDAWTRAFRGFFEPIGAAIKRVAESPRSQGYEPWLVDHGYSPLTARAMARLIVRRGNRVAKEAARLPAAVKAIRFLAIPGRQRRAISRKAGVLLSAWEETSVLDAIFTGTNLDVFEFVRVLKSVVEGDEVAYQRLTEIAASLAPSLPLRRGPKVSAATAAHEFFLGEVVRSMEQRSFTWNNLEVRCTDPATDATCREFGLPDFDSRPAYRRLTTRKSDLN